MALTIYPTFENKVLTAQCVFRSVLKAMSFPGTVVSVDAVAPWGVLDSASAAIVQTLCDSDTGVYFAPSLHQRAIIESAQFHCNVRLEALARADFVFISAEDGVCFSDLNHGDEFTPQHSATLIVQISNWQRGLSIVLSGPGIAYPRTVSPVLPDALLAYLLDKKVAYPCGVDVLLVCGEALMALPRSTKIELEKV